MTEAPLALDDHNLVWIDLEMTGLSPERDRIIEIAVVVTDAQLGRRTEGPVLAIHQSDATLATMDAWNTGTHGRSGLTDRVRASTVGSSIMPRMDHGSDSCQPPANSPSRRTRWTMAPQRSTWPRNRSPRP